MNKPLVTWETATIRDVFPIRCDRCGTVRPYIEWMEAFEASASFDGNVGICCPVCSNEGGKVIGEFVE